jgi:glycosyltransferase involved in cell wall biosynthesis
MISLCTPAPPSVAAQAAPLVSVLMPVYNSQKYLSRAIESVLNQSFRDFEFIMIDDGSIDDSLGIMEWYAQHHERIRIMSRPNTGIVGALNDGLEIARGALLARMDADDVCMSTRLEKQVAYLDAHPECVMVGSRVLLIDAEGSPICEWAVETTHDEIDQSHIERRWPVVHPSVVIRSEALKRLGGYRQKYDTQEDIDLFLRLAEIGQVANLPQVLLHYRQHFESTCCMRSREQQAIREELFREAYARRGIGPPESPRPCLPPFSKIQMKHRWWAWKALDAGNVHTARKHAIKAFWHQPLNIESWRLMYCAARGH